MKKKMILIVLGILALVLVGGGVWWLSQPAETAAPTPTPKPAEKVNTIPVEERPYVLLVPDTKEKGRGVVMSLYKPKKEAARGEYEIDYQTGNLLQGAFGRLKLTTFPEVVSIPFKSCSAGGKCTIHEDVTGGNITFRFDQPEKYVLKSEWSFIENKEKAQLISSRDSKFKLEGAGLAKSTHFAILNPPGYPENPSQKVLSNIYSVGTIAPVSGKLTVSIRLNEDATKAVLLAWDGKVWAEVDATVADKVATAPVSKWFEAYVVVAPGGTAE